MLSVMSSMLITPPLTVMSFFSIFAPGLEKTVITNIVFLYIFDIKYSTLHSNRNSSNHDHLKKSDQTVSDNHDWRQNSEVTHVVSYLLNSSFHFVPSIFICFLSLPFSKKYSIILTMCYLKAF